MKTIEQLVTFPGGENCNFIDHRDKSRLLDFLPIEDWIKLGFSAKEGVQHTPVSLTEECVLEKLRNDLAFAFEKCEDERGISSSLMFDVIKMWMWVLDDPLSEWTQYGYYGRPLFDAVAKKYNLPKS